MRSKFVPLVFLPIFLLGLSKVELNQEARTGWVDLHQGQTVGQTFVGSSNNLTGIKLFTRNLNLANREPITFHLRESLTSDKDLATLTFSGANVGWDYALRIQFAPIAYSRGKSFYFFLESPTTEANQAIEFGFNQNDSYKGGEAFVNGKTVGGDLFFITFYKTSLPDFFALTVNNLFSRASLDQGFFIAYFFILLVAISGFVWSKRREK